MSAKINAATFAMVLAILALPSVVSALQGYVRHDLLNLTEATGNKSQPQMNGSRRRCPQTLTVRGTPDRSIRRPMLSAPLSHRAGNMGQWARLGLPRA
jgi:hypothetical protein